MMRMSVSGDVEGDAGLGGRIDMIYVLGFGVPKLEERLGWEGVEEGRRGILWPFRELWMSMRMRMIENMPVGRYGEVGHLRCMRVQENIVEL